MNVQNFCHFQWVMFLSIRVGFNFAWACSMFPFFCL
uniref:Uncharacterized protein n=1 Tax=Arundo donax TaxID=35708 RepID=A0A0A8ZQ37_ARUDO